MKYKIKSKLYEILVDKIDVNDYRNNEFMTYKDFNKISSYNNFQSYVVKTIISNIDLAFYNNEITVYNFKEKVKEITEHGLDSGIISEMIYTREILHTYRKYKKDIDEIISNQIEDFGAKNLIDYLQNYTNIGDQIEDSDRLNEKLCIIAFENICFDLQNKIEEL